MSVSVRTQNLLAIALGDTQAAQELSADASATGLNPTFTTITTTGGATIGGFVSIAGNLSLGSANAYEINDVQVVGARQTKITPVVVTFTSSAPANYASPTGALTIANGGTPTVVELVEYCDELRANIVALQAILTAHGLTN